MPQHRLEMDFAQTVLQKAQHQNPASQPSEAAASIPHSPFATPHSDSPLPPHHSLFRKRGLAWSLVAIAAAVLITITTKRSDQNRQLAQRGCRPSSALSRIIEKESVERSKIASEQSELKQLDEAAHSPPAASQPAAAARDDSVGSRLADTPAPATNSIATDKNAAKDAENLHFSLQGERRDGGESSKELLDVQQRTPLATDDRKLFKSAAPREANSFSASGGIGGKLANKSSAATSEESIANSPAAGSAIQLKAANAPQWAAGEPQPILVVHADISSDAARQGAFDQLLSKNDIALTAEKQKAAPEEYSHRLRGTTQLGVPSLDQRPLDVIYIEAAPTQIQNALAALRNSPSQFSAVTVTNLPDKQNLKLEEISEDKKDHDKKDTAPALGRAAE